MSSFSLRLGAALAVLALATSCAGPEPQSETGAPAAATRTYASTVISPAGLTAGETIAAPAGKPVLSVTGLITAANKGSTLSLDRPTLEEFGLREVRVHDPWVKQDLALRGVWLQDLLTVAGAKPEATKVRITALDDYSVELSLADVRAGGILLATSDGEGSDLPIDHGGPTRIVFAEGVPAGVNPDQWVWSLKTIDVT
jgi:hypothetical protein